MPRTPVGRRLPLGARHVAAALVAGAALVLTAACSTPAGPGTPATAAGSGGGAGTAGTGAAGTGASTTPAGTSGPTGRTPGPSGAGARPGPGATSAPAAQPAATHRPVPLPPPVPAPGTHRLRGVLSRVAVEPPSANDVGGDSDVRTYVRTDAGPVEIPADGVDHLATGSHVVADVSGGSVVAAGATSTPPAPTPPHRAVHEVVTVLVLPPGAQPDSTTSKGLQTAVDGPVSAYWSAQTGGLVSFKVSRSYGWLRVRSSCADAWSLWAEVAARVGFVPSPRRHLMVLVPASLDGCYAGLGTIGGTAEDGGYSYVRGTLPGLVAHELGHNLGLAHSNGLQCDRAADGTWSGTAWSSGCVRTAYRDWYDVMGVSWEQLGTLSTAQAYRLGILGPDAVTTVTGPARVTLTAVSLHVGLRSLRIRTPGGVTYTVEYRPAVGADAWLAGDWRGLRPGVLVRRDDPEGDAGQTLLLDTSPSRAASFGVDWDSPLAPGGSFTVAGGRVVVRVEDQTATTALVSVQWDGKVPPSGTGTDLRRLGSRQAAGDSTRVVREALGAPAAGPTPERARATVSPPAR